jgi:two-component system response regulator YesN
LISTPSNDENEIKGRLNFYKINLKNADLCVILLSSNALEISDRDEYNKQLIRFEVLNAIEGIVSNTENAYYFEIGSSLEYAVILNCPWDNVHSKLEEFALKIVRNIKMNCGLTYIAGIGNIVHEYGKLPISYKSARTAIEHRFFMNDIKVISYRDVMVKDEVLEIEFDEENKSIVRALISGNTELLCNKLGDLFEKFKYSNLTAEMVRILCIALINMVLYEIKKSGENMFLSSAFNSCSPYLKLFSLPTLQEISEYITDLFCGWCENVHRSTTKKHLDLVQSIKSIIEQELDKDISVEEISNKLYISQGYATQIFKRVTGKGINRYIIETRMDKAKMLLKDASLKIIDIARMVGYNDPSYFSSVFKNEVGVSPRMYRKYLIQL